MWALDHLKILRFTDTYFWFINNMANKISLVFIIYQVIQLKIGKNLVLGKIKLAFKKTSFL